MGRVGVIRETFLEAETKILSPPLTSLPLPLFAGVWGTSDLTAKHFRRLMIKRFLSCANVEKCRWANSAPTTITDFPFLIPLPTIVRHPPFQAMAIVGLVCLLFGFASLEFVRLDFAYP